MQYTEVNELHEILGYLRLGRELNEKESLDLGFTFASSRGMFLFCF